MGKIGKITTGQALVKGHCDVCHKSGRETITDKKGRVWPDKQYTQIWEQVNWFRGDDEIIAYICRYCLKEHHGVMNALKLIDKEDSHERD